MSEKNSINDRQIFDNFTVLNKINSTDLDGRIYLSPETLSDFHFSLIGYDVGVINDENFIKSSNSHSDHGLGPVVEEDIFYISDNFDYKNTILNNDFAFKNNSLFLDNAGTLPDKKIIDSNDYSSHADVGEALPKPQLNVLENSSELNEDNAIEVKDNSSVNILPQADQALLSVEDTIGIEDHPIKLDISAKLNDLDGQETLLIEILNVPDGSELSNGRYVGKGKWLLKSRDLEELYLIPTEHFSGELNLTINAISKEITGDTNIVTDILSVVIQPVADEPVLETDSVFGKEDSYIALDIKSSLVDQDGSEKLSIILNGVPEGTILSAGTYEENGQWLLSQQDLNGLKILPPKDSNENFVIRVTSVSEENPSTKAWVTSNFTVQVEGVADDIKLQAMDVFGKEDHNIALDIQTTLQDLDGSENLIINIANVPKGASLSHGVLLEDGSYDIQAGDLTDLTLTPGSHQSGEFQLTVTATSIENDGDQHVVQENFNVVIEAQADPVRLSVGSHGLEDQDIPVNILAELIDQDGSENIASIQIHKIPEGVTFSAGQIDDNILYLDQSDLGGLTLRTPKDSNEDFSLTVKIVTQDDNGDQYETQKSFTVDVKGDADKPTVYANDAKGIEDHPIDLDLSGALTDLDGSETLLYEIRDVPEGFSFSTGRKRGSKWVFKENEIGDLKLIPATNFSGDVTFKLRAISKENDGDKAWSETSFNVHVEGEADFAESFTVKPSYGFEDSKIALDIRYKLHDDDGSETLSAIITDFPEGSVFSHGYQGENNSWIVHQDDVSDLSITPPLNSNEDIILKIQAVVTEENGDVCYMPDVLDLPVYVRGVADLPGLEAQAREGIEDEPLNLELGAYLNDVDGSENLSVVIKNIPNGFSLSPSGTFIRSGEYSFTAEEAKNLVLYSPLDYSGDITLDIRVVSQENDGDTAIFDSKLDIHIDARADQIKVTHHADGLEDNDIALNVSLKTMDIDGSEIIVDKVVISDVPEGAILSHGQVNSNGDYALSLNELSDLTIKPPYNSNDDFSLSITVKSIDENGHIKLTTDVIDVNITGVADTPTLQVEDVSVKATQDIHLDIHAFLTDLDSSEHLYYKISGVPDYFTVEGGIASGGGNWIVTQDKISDTYLKPLAYFDHDFILDVSAISVENDGDISSISHNLNVFVQPIQGMGGLPSKPPLSNAPRFANYLGEETFEDGLIDVDGTIYYNHGGKLSFVISDLPEGVKPLLGFNNLDGSWTVPIDDIAQLKFTSPEDFSGELNIQYKAIQIENGKMPNSADKQAIVVLEAVADEPLLQIKNITGYEDQNIPVEINISVADIDGSEYLAEYIEIFDVPEGASFNVGEKMAEGHYIISTSDLDNLKITPPPHMHGAITLRARAYSEEISNQDQNYAEKTFTIQVQAIADKAALSVQTHQGTEDEWVDLNISANFIDQDGSESMTIIISSLPDEARLSQGLNNGDGSWTLKSSQLTDLQFRAPDDFSGDIPIIVTVNTIEKNGNIASITTQDSIYFEGVVDGLETDIMTEYLAHEDQEYGIPISFNNYEIDRDGSETQEIIFSNVSDNSYLSVGERQHDGTWKVSEQDIEDLEYHLPEDFSGDIDLEVVIRAAEDSGSYFEKKESIHIHVDDVADNPELEIHQTHYDIEAGNSASLDIEASLQDTDGSENLSVFIKDVPDDVTFSQGSNKGNGIWLFDAIDANNLNVNVGENQVDDFSLLVQAQAEETLSGKTAHSDSFLIFFDLYSDNDNVAQQDWLSAENTEKERSSDWVSTTQSDVSTYQENNDDSHDGLYTHDNHSYVDSDLTQSGGIS